jgi:hypothetical protein
LAGLGKTSGPVNVLLRTENMKRVANDFDRHRRAVRQIEEYRAEHCFDDDKEFTFTIAAKAIVLDLQLLDYGIGPRVLKKMERPSIRSIALRYIKERIGKDNPLVNDMDALFREYENGTLVDPYWPKDGDDSEPNADIIRHKGFSFSQMPAELTNDKRIQASARDLYGLYRLHNRLSRNTAAKKLGVSVSTIKRWKKILEDTGWITIKVGHNKGLPDIITTYDKPRNKSVLNQDND